MLTLYHKTLIYYFTFFPEQCLRFWGYLGINHTNRPDSPKKHISQPAEIHLGIEMGSIMSLPKVQYGQARLLFQQTFQSHKLQMLTGTLRKSNTFL